MPADHLIVQRDRTLEAYVALVIVAGFTALVILAGSHAITLAGEDGLFWLLSGLVLLGELCPISIPREGGVVDEATASTAFAFAILIAFGAAPAVIVQCAASVVADVAQRRTAWKVAFNAAQYGISLGVAGLVYSAAGGGPAFNTESIGAYVAAAAVFYVLNTVIIDVAAARIDGRALLPYLATDLVLQAQATLPLLALAPVVVSAADESRWLVVLGAAPALAVWWGSRLAADNARLAAQLQGSLDHLTEANRLKDDFVAVVSHELRTPLTSIQGYLKTVLQMDDLPHEQRRQFLEAADRQGDRLRRLIEELLVTSKIESSADALRVIEISFGWLVTQVVDELRPSASGHAFDVRIAADLPTVRTDEGKVHQVLSNLVENALKYSPPDTRVTVTAEPAVRGVIVSVGDEGLGIAQEHRERVFDRFFQIDQSTTRAAGGTGLGLYICRQMADAIGGRLWLAKSDADGSTFSLFVPEDPPQAATDLMHFDGSQRQSS